MNPEMNLTYEMFIRSAFSIDKNTMIDRWGDPAGLANTDVFSHGDIEEIKAGVAYSMSIFRKHIANNNNVTDQESNGMDQTIRDVLNAKDKSVIYNLIERFRSDYVSKYIVYLWNRN